MLLSRGFSFGLLVLLSTPVPAEAQGLFGRLRNAAHGLQCRVGACGNVQQASHFAPENYESVAVTVFDGTSQFSGDGSQGLVRDAFDARLIRNGFLIAANSNPEAVREMAAKGEGNWDQEQLAQLREFITGVDAVIVVEIRQVDMGTCALPDESRGSQANVHLAVRWLNVDAGDVPWVGRHSRSACAGTPGEARTDALNLVAVDLAGSLPRHDG